MCYWEEFKKQASEDYLQASEEYAFATEYDTKDEIERISVVLNERERVLEKICEIDNKETMNQLLGINRKKREGVWCFAKKEKTKSYIPI